MLYLTATACALALVCLVCCPTTSVDDVMAFPIASKKCTRPQWVPRANSWKEKML